MKTDRHSDAAAAAFALHKAELAAYVASLPQLRREGEEALRRLLPMAHGNSGQCRRVATFLLGLYNGDRFPFDLTDLRGLDLAIFEDCISVLRMDKSLEKEVHRYFDRGGEIWEQLARDWNVLDRSQRD